MKEIMEHSNTQQRSLNKFLKKILLSVSIFSFLFSYYHSFYSSSLLEYPRNLHHFSANPFRFSSHAMNKSYVFLICNGILVFLSKTSGLVPCSPGFDVNDLLQKRVNDDICLQMYDDFFDTKEPVLHKELLSAAPNAEEQGEEDLNEEMKQVSIFIADEEEKEEEEKEKEVEEMLSTEELNQKFEEFIRRMKEDIMINEARELVIFK
ncbi:uncharacterized protein LOC142518235 [Primulina tabacum]|uniref:uncharacterized protein LOC142518235 n=1 Tax=Primulina tabacum TaxID=48773 RepID=UPI003F5A7577